MVLLIITLLALLSASFAFQVNAHRAGVKVMADRLQLREAAEAGIHQALDVLRESRHDATLWSDNPELFHNRVVWSVLGDWADIDVPGAIEPEIVTYRYSLVADDPFNDLNGVRYGIIDESSKLNINVATREQLLTLFTPLLPEEVDPVPLVEALIDWRDSDSSPEAQGAEQDFYAVLEPPYTIKNGPFETVEELLLVKGFTARILFGEDADRNGLLTPNEDDSFRSFPPDNEDGQLQRGLCPFITVWSRDLNRSNDNHERVDLNGDVEALRDALQDLVPDEVIDYIVKARGAGASFTSPVELYGFTLKPGKQGNDNDNGNDNANGNENGNDEGDNGDNGDNGDDGEGGNHNANDNGDGGDNGDDGEGGPGGPGRKGGPRAPQDPPGGQGDDGGGPPQGGSGALGPSPVELQDLPVLCDRTTAIRQPGLVGQININTAPREVLNCLVNEDFTAADVDALVAGRTQLSGEDMKTVAWPVVFGLVTPESLSSIYPMITARCQQFTIDAIGHGDHIGQMVRIQAVVELRGQVPQFLYYRDITELGTIFPIRGGGENFVQDRTR
jgi:type II secretory pathway component PulK